MSLYDIFSYFDYIYPWAYLAGPRGTKIMGFGSYTLVTLLPPDGATSLERRYHPSPDV
jgi:hypothetical protein